MISLKITTPRLAIGAVILSLLSACGGGAGDDDTNLPNDAAARAVEPLVGVWNLPDDWNGEANDEAYLLVKAPDTNGVAEATIYDLDDSVPGAERNCFTIDGLPGTIEQSLSDELFLDVSAYPTAIVALLANGSLEISVFSEAAGSSVAPDRILIATRLDITENEIELCSN